MGRIRKKAEIDGNKERRGKIIESLHFDII